jgi:drug/metabolite transporter (DMT)-like permease
MASAPASPAINRTMGPTEWGLLVLLSVLWGGSYLFIGLAVRDLPPFTIVAVRLVIASVGLWLMLPLFGTRMPRGMPIWAAFLALGFINNAIPFSLIVWGQTHIPVAVASILNATTPLFGVVVAHVLTRDEKMTPLRLLGVVIGFLGAAIMVGVGALRSLGIDVVAELALLSASLSYAVGSIFARRFGARGVPPVGVAVGQITAAAILMVPVALIVDQPWKLPPPSATTIMAILALALVCTSIAYLIYFRILATAGATNLLLVTFLVPVSAILLGSMVMGDRLEPKHLLGMALIGLGLAAIDGRPFRWLRDALPTRRPGPRGYARKTPRP